MRSRAFKPVRRARARAMAVRAVAGFLIGLAWSSAAWAFGALGPETCKTGFTWRQACGPNEHVCVSDAAKAQAAADNAAAASRRAGTDPNNVDACKSGFLWREACGPQDHVCVTSTVKTQTAADNAAAASRFLDPPVLWDVLTQHNDAARTGANLNETTLTPGNVTPSTFGRLLERSVDGQIIAQPLYESNQTIPGKGQRNVVYVATRNNKLYAFDADDTSTDPNAGQLWGGPVELNVAGPVPGMCPETRGPVGITSTPVIDRSTDTMYLVARRSDGTVWLHARDVATGKAKGGTPGVVQISTPAFDQTLELSRAGLLLQNGAIFVAFSALNCDNPGWRGWVLAYRAPDLMPVGAFSTSNGSPPGAGIWQSGNGLVGDGTNIYFATGNRQGVGPAAPDGMLDESFVKLAVGAAPYYGLNLVGSYTVSNRAALNNGDTDLGSGGPVLLPGGRLVGGGKQGKLYVLDSASMAPSQNPPNGSRPGGSDGFQAFINTWHDDSTQTECTDAGLPGRRCYMFRYRYEESELTGPNIHGGPVFWRSADPAFGLLYGMPEKDFLRSYRYTNSTRTVTTSPDAVSSVRSPDGMPGSFLSLSANGGSNGVIWASVPKADGQWQNVPGRLIAFDAKTLAEIWRDDDSIGFSKFTPPTVAGGKVFRPTFANKLLIYGRKSGATALPCYNIDQKYQNYTGADGLLAAPTGGEFVSPDGGHYRDYVGDRASGAFRDPVVGASIYWSPSTCAREVHGPIRDTWAILGWESGVLGYPVTDQTITPDGRGRFNHFQGGSIYWTAFTGAHEVYGAIRDRWSSLGWENSAVGYPMSGEMNEIDGTGRFNLFEHGTIHWSNVTGAVTVSSDSTIVMSPARVNVDRPGGDLTHFDLPWGAPELCQQRCTDNASCVGWTIVNAGLQGPNPVCWLKNALPVEVPNACCTSGIKVKIRPAGISLMEGRIDRPGMDFANFDLPSADPTLCQGECALNATCRAWTYLEPIPPIPGDPANAGRAPHCWLKSGIPTLVANGMTISGTK